jgi:hypothetical protein
MTGNRNTPLPDDWLNDGTTRLEDRQLQETVIQQYLKLRARTLKIHTDQLSRNALKSHASLIASEKAATIFVVLPQRGTAGSQHWLIELIFLNPDEPPFGIELAGDIVMGASRPGTERPDLDLRASGLEHGVSRRHALVHPGSEALILMDLGSLNGTWISGERLDPYVPVSITKSTIVSLGTLTFAIRIVSTPGDLGGQGGV